MKEGMILAGDGCPIAYRIDGPETAPVLCLSNSLGTAMAMWAPQMPAFTQRFQVLRYDNRGHGKSASPAGAYSMDRLGRDVIELLDQLAIERVHFCGLSLGGMIGQWLGVRAPERLHRLVLANSSSFMGPPSAWDDRIDSVLRDGMTGLAGASVARWFSKAFRDAAPDQLADVKAMLLATDPQGYAGVCAAIRDMDMRRSVSLIPVPTLVIGGSLDPATPLPESEDLAARISGARLAILPAAHLSNTECPDAFAHAVLDFLDGKPACS